MSSIDSQIARLRRREVRRMLREAGGSRKAVSLFVRDFPNVTIGYVRQLIEKAKEKQNATNKGS